MRKKLLQTKTGAAASCVIIFLAALCLYWHISSDTALSQDEHFQLVREGVSYYDSLLESGSVDFFLQTSSVAYPGRPRAPSGTWEGTFEFSGGRFRATITEDVTQYELNMTRTIGGTRQYAYDGETFEYLRDTQRGPLMERDSDVQYNPSHDPRFWGWDLNGNRKPLVNLIDTLNVQNIEPVDWDGRQTYYITGTLQDTVNVELWLNPGKSYRPERSMFSVPGEKTRTRVTKDFSFQEVAPDLWFPESAHAVTTIIDTETGAETDIHTESIRLTNMRINEHIPSHRFALDAPPGATVFDGRSRETFKVPDVAQQPITEPLELSPKAIQLLEHLKTEIAANAKFKSGEVEFSITLSEPRTFPIPHGTENPPYEDKGYWHITYRFDEEHQFYDVKARKKMEINGEPLPNWQETHHQYQVDAKTLHIWEKTGTEWKQYPPRAMPSLLLKDKFNPRWWSWPPRASTFERVIRRAKPIDIQSIDIDDTPYYYLTLYSKPTKKFNTTTTREIWMQPQKDYHATRMLTYSRRTSQTLEVFPDGTRTLSPPVEGLRLSRKTYQLAQYEPGLWFPKMVTEEKFHGFPMDKIFPDTPEAEYPVILREALIPQKALAEYLTWPNRKITMQVHRAVFNIPIEEKDLHINPDK